MLGQRAHRVEPAPRAADSRRCEPRLLRDASRRTAVSVVIPTYNGERFIAETLSSVLAQTHAAVEVIVVDDGSTDGTRRALEPFLGRIRCVRQANEGISAARNRGAAEARGAYLAFLDHDDCFEPEFLERTVGYLEQNPHVGLVSTRFRIVDEVGRRAARTRGKRTPGERYTTRSLLEGDVGTIRAPVVRRSVFEQIGGYDPAICGPEDCDLSLRLSLVAEMHHIAEPLVLYRSHSSNFSRNQLDNARNWLHLLGKLASSRPDVVREHALLLQKNEAKQLCRLARELLAGSSDRAAREEARRAAVQSIRLNPRRSRAYLYALLSLVPLVQPLYARLRRLELEGHRRLAAR